jgi:hypothetical protein
MLPKPFPELELIVKGEYERKALDEHGVMNYLRTFELRRFNEFLSKIQNYNDRFLKPKMHPETDGKIKFISMNFHKRHLEVLIKPATWIGLSQLNPRIEDKIQSLSRQWLPRILRSLVSSENLSGILENNDLDDIAWLAKRAYREAKWSKILDRKHKEIYEQILLYLEPFVKLKNLELEKIRVLNDLLARLHVASHSESGSSDDVVHYVVQSLENLGIGSQLTGCCLPGENKSYLTEAEMDRFSRRPHYLGMNAVLFSTIIRKIETHGSEKQKESLLKLPAFNENSQHFQTINIVDGNHTFVVPSFMKDFIPRFKPWPAWLFPNRYFRYQFFKKKHWFISILKMDAPANLLQSIQEEIESVKQEMSRIKDAKTRVFLERWGGCLLGVKHTLEKQKLADAEINETLQTLAPKQEPAPEATSAKTIKTLSAKQKQVLDVFYQTHFSKNVANLPIRSMAKTCKYARLSFIDREDYFSNECLRYINPQFFSAISFYLTEKASTNCLLMPEQDRRYYMACLLDYFAMSQEASIQEYPVNFKAQFTKILLLQLKCLCLALTEDYNTGRLTSEKVDDFHVYLKDLILIADQNPLLDHIFVKLCREWISIKNPHLLHVKFVVLLEGISQNRLSAPSLFGQNTKMDNKNHESPTPSGVSP